MNHDLAQGTGVCAASEINTSHQGVTWKHITFVSLTILWGPKNYLFLSTSSSDPSITEQKPGGSTVPSQLPSSKDIPVDWASRSCTRLCRDQGIRAQSHCKKLLLLTCHAAQQGKSPFRMEEAAPFPPTQHCHVPCLWGVGMSLITQPFQSAKACITSMRMSQSTGSEDRHIHVQEEGFDPLR